MRIGFWIPKATHTHTHTEYVIFIAFPLQQWLQDAPQYYVISSVPLVLILASCIFRDVRVELSHSIKISFVR